MGDTAPMDYYRQNVVYSTRRTDSRQRYPHLVTPEASHNSGKSLDEQAPRTYARDSIPICALLAGDNPDREDNSTGQRHDGTSARRDSRPSFYAAPHTSPYQSADNQKPSLPPLKTVFGGKITSSFDTPQTQPDPGEPSFSTSKYIPPALCPNKKPRTEIFFELSPTFNPMSSLSSTGLPTASLEYKSHYPAHRASISQGQPTPHREYESRRRPPLHQGYKRRQTDASPNGVKCQFARGSGDESRPRTNGAITKDTYRSPDRTAVPSSWLGPPYVHPPTTLARPSVDHFAPPFTDQYALDADHEMRRRSSVASPCDFAPPPPVDPTRAGHPLSSSPRYLLSLNECSPSKEYLIFMDRGRPQPPGMMASNNRVGFQDRQAMFFISSHRDYQQGKRRKRSNLPKQSTDIMKTWFDQNISNPYPSEEQKAMFSCATCISMTQVSNWFINHRRRCPELRDKKDRMRAGGLNSGN